MSQLKSWIKENQFLVAQAIATAALATSLIAYYVKMETRVSIMETRGASYTAGRLVKIDERLTVVEQQIKNHQSSIDRIVDIMTTTLKK